MSTLSARSRIQATRSLKPELQNLEQGLGIVQGLA